MNEHTNSEMLFTSASILDLLVGIEELSSYTIKVTDRGDGELEVAIGDSVYTLKPKDETTAEVEDAQLEEIQDHIESAYQDSVDENEEMELLDAEPVQSGILKELVKTLAIGGMVRLTTKMLGGKK